MTYQQYLLLLKTKDLKITANINLFNQEKAKSFNIVHFKKIMLKIAI